jgi:hypothetical protein
VRDSLGYTVLTEVVTGTELCFDIAFNTEIRRTSHALWTRLVDDDARVEYNTKSLLENR